jgi:glycosyltransferase involved in cell wall biosynthesis
MWTVHNLEPHEGAYCWDRYGYRLLAHDCDVVMCHSESAAREVRDAYDPRGRIVVMPMGDPGPAYPRARSRDDVLAEFHLDPQRPVVSCLGRMRPDKGLDVACGAVERLNGRVHLIIGGVRHNELDASPIFAAIGRTSGVVIDRELTDQEFADLTAASDAVLLPYRAITGSSALLSALGLGRGVVTSDLPYFREILAGEPDAGMVVSGWDTATWADALLQYLERRPAAARRRATLRLAARYHWDRGVEPLVDALGIEDGAGARGGVQRAATAC